MKEVLHCEWMVIKIVKNDSKNGTPKIRLLPSSQTMANKYYDNRCVVLLSSLLFKETERRLNIVYIKEL